MVKDVITNFGSIVNMTEGDLRYFTSTRILHGENEQDVHMESNIIRNMVRPWFGLGWWLLCV